MHLRERQFHLTLTRHAQTIANVTKDIQGHLDTPLTELGVRQAISLAEHFKSAGWLFDRIYSSDLGRAYKTANIIAATCGRAGASTVVTDARLRERGYGPEYEGKPVANLMLEAFKFGYDHSNFTQYSPAGSESMKDVLARVQEFCCETLWVECQQDEEVLIVTHWATLKELLKILQPRSNGAICKEHLLESPNTAFSRFWIHCGQDGAQDREAVDGCQREESQLLIRVHVVCLHKTSHVSPSQVTAGLKQQLE